MNFWMLVQIVFDLIFCTLFVLFWIRSQKEQKEDPRLSKGLQLLQSKIAVLEDLSDKTEHQVQRMTLLLEQKSKEIQNKIQSADQMLMQIEANIKKSMEVAQIFQDKIPHHEIIERQNSLKYINAAKLANQGLTPEEISAQVDLTIGEIEFIAKVNRNELQFDSESLPGWAHGPNITEGKKTLDPSMRANSFAEQLQKYQTNFAEAFEVPKVNTTQIEQLKAELKATQAELQSPPAAAAVAVAPTPTTPIETAKVFTTTGREKIAEIRPFEFKKIDSDFN